MSSFQPPFSIEGAPNVFLETVKRGEDDDFGADSARTTVVLRLYEALGGHAQAKLRVAGHLDVFKAYTTNLLEDVDERDELNVVRVEDASGRGQAAALLRLDFRGFEVKTVKLVLGHGLGFTAQTG